MKPSVAPFVRAYLREAPLFMPVVRAVECAIIREIRLSPGPVLDLGCGDGLFASLAFERRPALGLDPKLAVLREARVRGAHEALAAGSATELPLRDGSIAVVVANSVLEHIPDLGAALTECFRILEPGGRLLITSPSERFGEMLLGARVLRALGLHRAGAAYARWFNRHSLHFHTLSARRWREKLGNAGFEVRESSYYLNAKSHAAFDLLHYLSGWRWARKRLTGRWCGKHAVWNRAWASWITKLAEGSWPAASGPYVFIDAERKH